MQSINKWVKTCDKWIIANSDICESSAERAMQDLLCTYQSIRKQ